MKIDSHYLYPREVLISFLITRNFKYLPLSSTLDLFKDENTKLKIKIPKSPQTFRKWHILGMFKISRTNLRNAQLWEDFFLFYEKVTNLNYMANE